MKHLFLVQQYLLYFFSAKRNGHGVHSPFVFDFIKNVLQDDRNYYAFDEIKNLRHHLYQCKEVLNVEDFGAGSLKQNFKQRVVSDIAKTAGRNEKFGQLLFRIVNHYKVSQIFELGTSLGIGTSYMAKANPEVQIKTIEGSTEIAQKASESFKLLNIKNVTQVIGNFDDVFKSELKKSVSPNLIFIDGNHRKEPTIEYFKTALEFVSQTSIIIFDDIHWSNGMLEAWQTIISHEKVLLSVDLFYFGIVFFSPDFKEKQQFVLKY